MTADKILKKYEDDNEYHFHTVDRKWIIEAMEEYAALRQRQANSPFHFRFRNEIIHPILAACPLLMAKNEYPTYSPGRVTNVVPSPTSKDLPVYRPVNPTPKRNKGCLMVTWLVVLLITIDVVRLF